MNIQTLLTEHWYMSWEFDHFFQALSEDLQKGNLWSAYQFVWDKSQKRSTKFEMQYRTALQLVGCACLAALEPGISGEEIIQDLMNGEIWPDLKDGTIHPLPGTRAEILPFLKRFDWPDETGLSWTWDAICQLQNSRKTTAVEDIIVPIVRRDDKDQPLRGMAAWLIVEAFPGLSDKLVCFSDSRNMAFLKLDETTEDSIQKGQQAAWNLASDNGCPPADVRWRIEDFERKDPIHDLDGESVGAAFALALAKVLHSYAEALPKGNP